VRAARLPDGPLPAGFHPIRVVVDGRSVAGAETGAGPPLVLLHGLGGTWRYWAPAMALLAGRARCIALDLPGFGQSDARPGGFALDSAAGDLAAVVRSLGSGPAVICGHSLGGPLAVRLGRSHPDVASRLVLVGPSGIEPTPAWQRRALALVPAYDVLRRAPVPWERGLLRVRPLRRAVLGMLVDDPATVSLAMARSIVDGGREARELPSAARASLDTGLADEAREVAAPIAAIWGDRDRMVPPAHAERLLRAVPSATLHLLRACGHLPMVERPEAFAALLAGLAAG
jgi:pimeloyl-ACP methyl ester carboxylesterase